MTSMASPLCHSAEVSPSYRLDAWRELSTISLFLKICFLQFQDHLQCSHGCLRKGRSMAAITRHVPGHIPILRIFPPVLCQPTACCADFQDMHRRGPAPSFKAATNSAVTRKPQCVSLLSVLAQSGVYSHGSATSACRRGLAVQPSKPCARRIARLRKPNVSRGAKHQGANGKKLHTCSQILGAAAA